jgi:hypothetical protein
VRDRNWDQIVAESGIPYPSPIPEEISFTMVVWNDAERADKLLAHVRPWFKNVAVAVQESPDNTLEVVRRYADLVVEDQHHGFGDASFGPRLLPKVFSRWSFKVDCDEWPTEDLLGSLAHAIWWADRCDTGAVWIPFRSITEGMEWEVPHSHLRLFHTRAGWPGTLHSRPPIDNGVFLPHPTGRIVHTRSLDEMVRDYLNYYRIGQSNNQWREHNTLMMREACKGAAARYGWEFVQAFEWWPQVREIAFSGTNPENTPEF